MIHPPALILILRLGKQHFKQSEPIHWRRLNNRTKIMAGQAQEFGDFGQNCLINKINSATADKIKAKFPVQSPAADV